MIALSGCSLRQSTSDAVGAHPPQRACVGGGDGQAAAVADKANAFAALLSDRQRAALVQEFTLQNAIRWSNLPISIPRLGVKFGDLDATLAAAARDVVAVAMSSCGLKVFDELRLADSVAGPKVPQFNLKPENFFISFLGKPSATTPWMLKLSGHHLAYNITFNGRQASATPLFDGVEPERFTIGDKTYEPLKSQSVALSRLAHAVSAYPDAKLPGTFNDLVKSVVFTLRVGAPPLGGHDTGFPHTYPTGTEDRGVRYGALTKAQQQLVSDAVGSYLELPGRAVATPLRTQYLDPAALADTYIGISGSPDLKKAGSYVRIDGPRVWIELVVQTGVAFVDEVHFHSVWRDKVADYGGEFTR
ncbi:DUF3500 domain-containing protein [Sphaerotilus sp.]|uniref:DUF3500 domain-containing protein n=1 Tax=Sphaerotilus sp. TaxID=2093942 RepID=UPI00286D7E98|nr:DUF3500 domain-containing protein [Sphaerotilus sp.]